jgi:hypothetical protein
MGKMKRLLILINIIPLFLISGCSPDSLLGIIFSPPHCEVSGIQKYDAAPGEFAKFVITVKNNGEATAYDVGCSIKLKNGNTIIDWGNADFGTLESGESAIAEAWFTEITKQTDYQSYQMTLYWYDADNGYYQN